MATLPQIMDMDTFCAQPAQDQKDEIARLAEQLNTNPGPDNNGPTRRATYQALLDEANSRQVAEQDAQIDNYMGNVPADAFGNANLGPAVSMNGDQAVFDEFSLGTPAIPPPSKSLTVAQIREGLAAMDIEIPQNVTRKADLLKLYETNYPPSPQFSPQSPPMMGMDNNSSSGMSKEGVGSSSKSSGSSSSGINLSAQVPAIEINAQPTSTEITREYANIGRAKLNTVFQRMVQGAAIQGRGSLNQRTRYNVMMAEATQRLSAATNFFETNKKVFYLFTGRINVGAGRSIALRIAPGAGNRQLSAVTRQGGGSSTLVPGYTSFVVARQNPDGILLGPPPSTEYGTYAYLTQTLGTPPQTLQQLADAGDRTFHPELLDPNTLLQNCLYTRDANTGMGYFYTQIPVSREVLPADQGVSSNTDDHTRMNLLYFMNPPELADCFEQGLFHQLEYYSDKFHTSISARWKVHLANHALTSSQPPSFLDKFNMLRQVLLESFTGIEAWTPALDVAMGNPDTVYLYMVYKHFVQLIQKLTNELIMLNTNASNAVQGQEGLLNAARDKKYTELRAAIKEMDAWNYSVQTSRTEDYMSANHTNFSALGISRDPSDFTAPYSTRRMATYKIMGGTKPPSCYPRWMANTFSAMKAVEDTVGAQTQQQLDAAVDLNVLLFNQSRPTTQQMLIFGNTQSILAEAQRNRDQLLAASPQEKLRLLSETRATSDNQTTVGQEMAKTNTAQAAHNAAVLEVMDMSDDDFFALTGMQKSRIRAQRALQVLTQKLQNRNYQAFNEGDMVEMPIAEKAAQIREIRAAVKAGQLTQTSLPSEVGSNLPNPKVRIKQGGIKTDIEKDGIPDIVYTCSGPEGDLSIFQLALLSSSSNVALANENLIKRAMQGDVSPNTGIDAQTAARLLGRTDGIFTPTAGNMDIEERLYTAKLEVLQARELLSNEEAQHRADATILQMKRYQLAQEAAMRQIVQLQLNERQLAALTQQQGQVQHTESQDRQAYIFKKYQLYKRKWMALNRSWNELHRLDAVNVREDGTRPALPTWRETTGAQASQPAITAPVRVLKVGIALRTFDFVTRNLGLANADPTSITNRLRSTVFETDETLETTWNNGVLKSFSQWASTDPEVAGNASYTEAWYAGWLQQSRRLNQLVVDQVMEEQQAEELERQQAARDAQDAQEVQRLEGRKRDIGQEEVEGDESIPRSDDQRKKPASSSSTTTTTTSGSSNNNTDGDGDGDVTMMGGKRKNKTRKRKNKTKRRKKMKGGKKTKSKRKKKKSKTRRKRGGRDCKKILKEEKVCDKKSWMKASRKLHPDKGGDGDRFRDMNECYQANKGSLSCDSETKIVNPDNQINNEPLLLMDTLPEVSGKKAKEIFKQITAE